MATQPSSATEPGERFVAALAERDFQQLAGTLAPGARLRALLPSGFVELSSAEGVSAKFASWFGDADEFEVIRSGCDSFSDRLHVFYSLRIRRSGEFAKLVEQHLLCSFESNCITGLDLVCTGFRPDVTWMMHRPLF